MMKKDQNNQHYFKISQQNPEKSLDSFYIFDSKHPNLPQYIANTKEIKNILITIKTLQNKKENKEIIMKYFKELSQALGKYSTCSEFSCFINACDSFLDLAKNDLSLLKKITQKYFEKRVLNEAVPEEWIQAVLDSSSGRKKGKSGEKKLLHILKELGYQEVKKWEEFFKTPKCVARFSKIFDVKNVRASLGVKIRAKKQGKKLDLIVKYKNKIFLIEAKHLNTSGGGQDKQISELIEVISLKEKNKHISYLAFLDGSYSNILLGNQNRGEKLATQKKDIQKYLSQNKNSYWVNTTGFKKLLV